ncbi:MAG: response regulator [Candidatus Methanofastidiosia archaeon]
MMSVLIVDDDEDIRFIYSKTLEKKYNVFEAENGETALKIYKSKHPDLVIMDTKMPDGDGIEITKQILSINPDARIIGATGFTDKTRKFLEAGAKCVIEKPFSLEKLLDTVEKYISGD